MLLDTDLSVNISIIDLLLIKSKKNKFEIVTFLTKMIPSSIFSEFIFSSTELNEVELSALIVPFSVIVCARVRKYESDIYPLRNPTKTRFYLGFKSPRF